MILMMKEKLLYRSIFLLSMVIGENVSSVDLGFTSADDEATEGIVDSTF